jgi:hypothetical protein
MKHLAASRLLQLCAEAVVQDEEEEAHLTICQDCRMLLRAFAEDRARYKDFKSHQLKGNDFAESA